MKYEIPGLRPCHDSGVLGHVALFRRLMRKTGLKKSVSWQGLSPGISYINLLCITIDHAYFLNRYRNTINRIAVISKF